MYHEPFTSAGGMSLSITPFSTQAGASPSESGGHSMAIMPTGLGSQTASKRVERARQELQAEEGWARQRELEARLHKLNAEAARWNLVEAEARAEREAELQEMDRWVNGLLDATRMDGSERSSIRQLAQNHRGFEPHSPIRQLQLSPQHSSVPALSSSPQRCHLLVDHSHSAPGAVSSAPLTMEMAHSSMPHFLGAGKDGEND
jgi:hypothetical protein